MSRFEREFDTELSVDGALALRAVPLPPIEEFEPEPEQRSAAEEAKARRRNGLAVAPPAPVRVPRMPFVMLIIVAVIGGVLGILVINTKINENQFQLNNLQGQQADLDRRQSQLEQEIAAKAAPNNLAAAAKMLGLVPAGAPGYIRLPDGRIVGVPRPADDSVSGSAATATGH
jgi:hypothetical protein